VRDPGNVKKREIGQDPMRNKENYPIQQVNGFAANVHF
jgi:hypothetical protein